MKTILLIAMTLAAGTACTGTAFLQNAATLYRSSVVIENARIHIATFDVADNRFATNWDNCQIAAELFQQQPGVTVRYWCEKGRYRK